MSSSATSLSTSDLLDRFAAAWQAATHHPFLIGVRDGSLPTAAFEAWLAQDYLFVADLLWFQARLLARAPRGAHAVLAGGLVALESELTWFEQNARARGFDLSVPRRDATTRYNEFFRELDERAYSEGITALWACERAYLDAWSAAAPGAPAFRPFVERWTVPAFATYVADLARAADAALRGAAPEEQQAAEAAFLNIARLEADFWQMAWTGSGRSS